MTLFRRGGRTINGVDHEVQTVARPETAVLNFLSIPITQHRFAAFGFSTKILQSVNKP